VCAPLVGVKQSKTEDEIATLAEGTPLARSQ